MNESDIFNLVNPVVGIHKYPNGVLRIKRKSKIKGRFTHEAGRQGKEIVKFSPKSMARLIATANATSVELRSMITLTYPSLFPKDGAVIKADMNHFLTMMRDRGWGDYLWFLEFQKRGAPHFHILSTQKAISPRMRIRVAEMWVGRMSKSEWLWIAAMGESLATDECQWKLLSRVIAKAYWFTLRGETWEYIRDANGARKYATKYAAKEYQKTPPDDFEGVGRFWGCSKGVTLGEGVYQPMGEKKLREYLASTEHATADWEVLPKYLFNVEQEANPGPKEKG